MSAGYATYSCTSKLQRQPTLIKHHHHHSSVLTLVFFSISVPRTRRVAAERVLYSYYDNYNQCKTLTDPLSYRRRERAADEKLHL